MDIKNLTNYLHNKYKEKGKYISKRVIEECINEGINFATHKEDAPFNHIEGISYPNPNIHTEIKKEIDIDYYDKEDR